MAKIDLDCNFRDCPHNVECKCGIPGGVIIATSGRCMHASIVLDARKPEGCSVAHTVENVLYARRPQAKVDSASTNTGSLQCTVCGSQKVNILHECEDCKSPIDVSNWRDRAQQAGC